MAVLIEDLNLIVRVPTLARKYPGGLVKYRRDTLGLGFCCDGLLTRVGSACRSEVETMLESLIGIGFLPADEFGYRDVAFVDERHGLDVGCFWLNVDTRADGLSLAYLPKTDPSACLAVPSGWTLDRHERERNGGPSTEPRAHLLFLRRDGRSDVFLDRRSGREVRVPTSGSGGKGRVVN